MLFEMRDSFNSGAKPYILSIATHDYVQLITDASDDMIEQLVGEAANAYAAQREASEYARLEEGRDADSLSQ